MHDVSHIKNSRYNAIHRLLSDPHLWFYLAVALWMSYRFLEQSLYNKYLFTFGEMPIRLGIFLLIFLHELLSRQGKQTLYGILGIALAFAIGTQTDSYIFIDPIVLIFSARSVPFRSIAKVALATTIIVPGFIIVSSQIGLITDYLWEREAGNFIRHSLGFRYTTLSTHMLLSAALLYAYIKKEKANLAVLGMFFVANYALYKLTDSRTSFLLTLVVLFAVVVLKSRALSPIYTKSLQYLTASLSWIIFPIISYVLATNYNKNDPNDARLNKLLSNRLFQTKETMDKYDITLFGQNVKVRGHSVDPDGNVTQVLAGETSNYVDNSFLHSLLSDGLVIMLVVLVMLTFIGAVSARHNQKFLSLALFIIAVHSLLDPQLLLLQYTPFLFLISTFPSILNENPEKENDIGTSPAVLLDNSFDKETAPPSSDSAQAAQLQNLV